eukprot:CAMPEP_0197025522 /NCGR_PEP_ID=MMETSP1384-20130603/5827_1 /TAXON_ID=29189 /ORGANISM="Ammonia sp." /LENGTH=373 /DNA_ID=CAMNT_0042454059 /DNA_START=123 /DNA_END=1244 /DNA_ORIENTATION=+
MVSGDEIYVAGPLAYNTDPGIVSGADYGNITVLPVIRLAYTFSTFRGAFGEENLFLLGDGVVGGNNPIKVNNQWLKMDFQGEAQTISCDWPATGGSRYIIDIDYNVVTWSRDGTVCSTATFTNNIVDDATFGSLFHLYISAPTDVWSYGPFNDGTLSNFTVTSNTYEPTTDPTVEPTYQPTKAPSVEPTAAPTEEKKYVFVSDMKTFSEAETYCQSNYMEGNLVSIHSEAENAVVQGLCENLGQLQAACWLGMDNPTWTGLYEWYDGTDIDYTNWYVGEPDGGSAQPCVVYRVAWHTVGYCETNALPFVCQYYGDEIVEMSTTEVDETTTQMMEETTTTRSETEATFEERSNAETLRYVAASVMVTVCLLVVR